MKAQQLNTNMTQESPLDRLANATTNDMAAVNQLILNNMQSDVPLIPQIAAYLIAAGGKRIRPLLTLAATRLFDADTTRPYALAAAVEFIHTATLLHDDVVDESTQRRGKDSANMVFGNQSSVLVGDFLFSRAFQLMVSDGSLEVLRILSSASAIISEGEVMQLAAQGNIETGLDDYYKIISAKTAALFAASTEIGPVIAGKDKATQEALRIYGHELGIAFQIADDVLDYSASQETLGKTVGDDFREGKLTAPVILAIKEATEEELAFWTRTMVDRNQTDADLKTAQNILEKHKALDKSYALAQEHAQKAIASLENVLDSDMKTIMTDIVDYMVNRNF
jgi:octaprenyl-diphosphate synthase